MKLFLVAALVIMSVGGINCWLIPDNEPQQQQQQEYLQQQQQQLQQKFHKRLVSVPKKVVNFEDKKGLEDILTDEQIAKIILDVIEKTQSYGIMDIITHLPGLIKQLKPILTKYMDIIMDSELSLSEKFDQIWEHTKDSMVPIMKLVGSEAAKEILKQLIIAAAGSLGR